MTINKVSDQVSQVIQETQEIQKKKYELDKHKITTSYDDLLKRQQETLVNASINVSSMSKNRLNKIKQETREYLEHAKNSKCFINDDFSAKVPFFGRNIIFIGAKTGQGKTTIGKNIAYHTLSQGGRVLYLTNEENTGDVYNGVTCLCKGWSYTKHDKFTEEQLNEFDRMIDVLSHRMVVIDDNYNGDYGQTTTLEGMKAILTNLHTADVQYDAIVIDYYQNVCRSSERPHLNNWQVQEEFAKFLDSFKNTYLAPIVVLSQLKEGKDLGFKEAIEGRKMILNVATCAMKVTAEREFSRTAFYVEKSRFTESVGNTIYVGFERGRYVDYTGEFKNNAELEKVRKEQSGTLSKVFGGEKDG